MEGNSESVDVTSLAVTNSSEVGKLKISINLNT